MIFVSYFSECEKYGLKGLKAPFEWSIWMKKVIEV